MTGQARRQATKSTNRGHRWLTVLITISIAVLLVLFGAQLAYGPNRNNNVGASTLVTPASSSATVVASAATPLPTRPPAQATPSVVPTLSATAVAQAAVTPVATATPPETIKEGAPAAATSAIASFVKANGSALGLGSATSAPFTAAASGVTGEYFANAVLEYHPEFAGTPYSIELSRIGVALANLNGLTKNPAFASLPTSTQDDANCWFVQATNHRLCGGFRDYWRSHGLDLGDSGVSYRESLALFGYPISEEFTDPASGQTVQYFERGVLSYDSSKAPAKRIDEQSSTTAILKRWYVQIISGAATPPGS